MSLTDSDREYRLRRRGVNQDGKHWSDAQKIEAVTLWLTMGNLALTAATLRIPEVTMRKWRATQWWKEIAEEIALQDRIKMSATAKNIIDKSLGVITDRLEQGDWIYDQKTGEMRRKPVSMKDALQVADRLMDRKDKLDKIQVHTQSAESVEAKLNKLMEKFSQVATGVAPVVTDVIYVAEPAADNGDVDAAYEEREEGLQLRQEVRSESGTSEEQSRAQSSSEGDE